MKQILAILAVLAVFSPARVVLAEDLTYLDLIKRLTNLERLATLPEPGETAAQCSSYDRASTYDAATDKYVDWGANVDGSGFIRKEGNQIVMAEMQGPGCIWRIWSADPRAGHVKIYLDGAAEPAVDLPFSGYFDHQNEPFTGQALVHNASGGMNGYVPIPYQKSCKVVADPNWGNYFHFTYATYPAGTKVPTFKRVLAPEESAALAAADKVLANCGADPAGSRPGEKTETINIVAKPGQTTTVATLSGARAITGIRVKFNAGPLPADMTVLRELALKITWDDDKEPAVWSPFGDFFGTAAGANKYRSLPLGVTDDGWYCFWYMPFARRARIELVNDGNESRDLVFEITHAPLTTPIEKLARFHAKWHRDAFLTDRSDRWPDWTMLTTEGRGRFVGVMLHIWNPLGNWWGEGDEKYFVDGEKFPSTFGTGSEDYFGYAWGNPALFQNAYHNQTISQDNKGHISLNRWLITDNVGFQKSFEGDIEKYFPNSRPALYAATVYWYLSRGGKDPYGPVPVDQRVGYWEPKEGTPKPNDVFKAVQMKVLAVSGGTASHQDMGQFHDGRNEGDQVWWGGGQPGSTLDLALPIARDGSYKISTMLTKARDYGIVQVSLDGEKLGDPIDLYAPNVMASGPIVLGTKDLKAGEHKLTYEITGADPQGVKGYMVGIDYVKVEPVK